MSRCPRLRYGVILASISLTSLDFLRVPIWTRKGMERGLSGFELQGPRFKTEVDGTIRRHIGSLDRDHGLPHIAKGVIHEWSFRISGIR